MLGLGRDSSQEKLAAKIGLEAIGEGSSYSRTLINRDKLDDRPTRDISGAKGTSKSPGKTKGRGRPSAERSVEDTY